MPIAIDGSYTPEKLDKMKCGGVPWFDHESGHAYRCDLCNAVIGSVGQSKRCKIINGDTEEEEPQNDHSDS